MSILWRVDSGAGPRLPGTAVGFYVKLASYPVSDMTLFDINVTAVGYHRIIVTSAGIVRQQDSWPGRSAFDVSLTGSTPLTLNHWYWITFGDEACFFTWTNQVILGHVSEFGFVATDTGTVHAEGNQDYYGQVGVGVAISNGNIGFPNTAGNEMSKFHYDSTGYPWQSGEHDPISPPSSNFGAGGTITFNAAQAVGVAAQLDDTSGSGNNGTPGPNGLTIRLDGPFVS